MPESYLCNVAKPMILDSRLAAAPWSTAEVGLWTAGSPIDQTTVIGDLTEQVGTGYARVALSAWSAAELNANEKAQSLALAVEFENTGVTNWTATLGWFIYSTALSDLIRVGTFDVSFTLAPSEIKTLSNKILITGDDP